MKVGAEHAATGAEMNTELEGLNDRSDATFTVEDFASIG